MKTALTLLSFLLLINTIESCTPLHRPRGKWYKNIRQGPYTLIHTCKNTTKTRLLSFACGFIFFPFLGLGEICQIPRFNSRCEVTHSELHKCEEGLCCHGTQKFPSIPAGCTQEEIDIFEKHYAIRHCITIEDGGYRCAHLTTVSSLRDVQRTEGWTIN